MVSTEKDLTKGSITKNLFSYAMPFVCANFLQALYGACDLIIVGHYVKNSAAISSVAIGAQIMHIVMCFIVGLMVGTTVLVGHAYGANKNDEIEKITGTIFSFFIWLSIFVTAVFYIFAPNLISIMQTPSEAFEGALSYVRTCSFAILFIFLFNALSSVLRGVGNSFAPMMFVSVGAAINIVLDVVFIGFFNFGVTGAAVATVISQFICALTIMLYVRLSKFSFKFRFRSVKIYFDKIKEMIRLGLPLSFQDSMVQMSFIILLSLANSIGVDASAGYGTANRLNGFTMLPAVSFAMALTSITAQCMGANKPERAKKTLYTAIGWTFSFGLICLIWQQIAPESAIGIFTNDENVIREGAQYLKSFSFDLIVVPFVFCSNSFFTGCGHTLFSMANNLTATLLIRVPLALIITAIFGKTLFNLGIAAPCASVCSVIVAMIYLKLGYWKNFKAAAKD